MKGHGAHDDGARRRRAGWIAATAVAIGAGTFVAAFLAGHASAAVATLASAWLLFAGMSAGAVAVSAALRVARAGWAGHVLPIAEAAAGFFPVAWLLLVLLLVTMPGHLRGFEWNGAHASRAARDLLASGALFLAGRSYVKQAQAAGGEDASVARRAVIYLLLYAAVLSLWAIDFVLSTRWAPSTVIPPYYFMGAFLSGLAWVALLVTLRGEEVAGADVRHDLGKLLLGFVTVWVYLLWSAFLPVWYENMPSETGLLLARWAGPWRAVTILVVVAVFAFPFWFFLPEATKRARVGLGIGASAVLLGFVGERLLLVVATADLRAGAAPILIGIGILVGALGLYVPATRSRVV